MSETRICKKCGAEFIGTGRQVYCGEERDIICAGCGKPFKQICGPQSRNTCSPQCANAARLAKVQSQYGGMSGVVTSEVMAKTRQRNIEKYGTPDPGNRPEAIEKRRQTCLERYGKDNVSKTDRAKEKSKASSILHYGVEHACQSPEVIKKAQKTIIRRYGSAGLKNKIFKAKKVATWRQTLGTDNPMQVPKLKSQAMKTCEARYGFATPFYDSEGLKSKMRERYGVDWYMQTPEAQERVRATNIERYGCANPINQEWVKEKTRQTFLKRYGVNNPGAVPELRAKAEAVIMEKYGVPWNLLCGRDPAKPCKVISKINRRMSKRLLDLGIPNTFEFGIGRRRYDLAISDTNILIEIDPTYTHNSYEDPWLGQAGAMSVDYHIKKTQGAIDHGYRCIHVFDWDNWDKITSLMGTRRKLYARNCSIHAVPLQDLKLFLDDNHLQGSCHGQIFNLGLYYQNNLVEIMTFGKPRYNFKYQWELLRLCTLSGLEIIGGAARLWKHALSELNPESIISYCDLAKFSGGVYERLGMHLVRNTSPAKVWSYDTKKITDNLLRQRGFDQLFGTDYGKGTSNEELMIISGWRPVYDCGQAVYEYLK